MTQSTPDVGQLLSGAQADGLLSASSANALQVIDLGETIQNALGVPVDDVTSSEVTLVSLIIDDSSSITYVPGNTEAVRTGHNSVIDALVDSKQGDSILLHTRYLNGTLLNPFRPLGQIERLNASNYNPAGGTPLYQQSVVGLGTVLTKAQEFIDNGVPVRTVTLIVSDGADSRHTQFGSDDVRTLVQDLLRDENHIVAAMGIDDGYTDFRQVFGEMGILDQWILTPGNTESEIRKAFQVFSQSAVRASQTATSFSQTAGGGFGS